MAHNTRSQHICFTEEVIAIGLELRTIGDLIDLNCKIANLVLRGKSTKEDHKAKPRINVKTNNSGEQ